MDLAQLDRNTVNGVLVDLPTGSTINGKLGDLYNCSASASASASETSLCLLPKKKSLTRCHPTS